MESHFKVSPMLGQIQTNKIMKAAKAQMNKLLRPYGISSLYFPFILQLYFNESMTLKELNEALGVDKAHTTRAIKDLKKKGYVYDDRKTPKALKYKLYLTNEGTELALYLKSVVDRFEKSLSEALSQEEIKTLVSLHEKILAAINNI